jgi:WD40 repeat protein
MVGTDGGNIVQLDVRNMSEPVCQVAAHKGRVRRISRPIGGHDVIPRAVFTASDDCTVRKLDFSQGGTFTSKVITELQHQDYVADVACMHANDDTKEYLRLLTGSTDKTITITDMF